MMLRPPPALALLLGTLALLSACGTPALEGPPAPGGCAAEQLAVVPVSMQRNEPHVAAEVNDWPVSLVLDTGAQSTMISAGVAAKIQLRRAAQGGTMQGLGGTTASFPARARVFTFAGVGLRDQPLRVSPVQLTREDRETPDGLLGADILSRFDLDMDFANSRVTVYRARTCPDGGPNWDFPYVTLDMLSTQAGRIMVPAELDGVPFGAVVDTGAEMTAIARTIALKTGRSEAEIDSGPAVTLTGATDAKVTARRQQFRTLRIGRMVANGPVLTVVPLPSNVANGILGMDFLRGRRVWVSYASQKVFVGVGPSVVAMR
jgi:predicted aspartyl protease